MRIAQLNMTLSGSTGRIMSQLAKCAGKNDHEVYTYSTHSFSYKYKKLMPPPKNHKYYGTFLENTVHYFFSRIFGFNGCLSFFGTFFLIKDLKQKKIDILHLHNLHNYSMNFGLLFKYIKQNNISVIWTLHDCWAFTGHCPHFDMEGCKKWKSGCHRCTQHNGYPASIFDDSKYMYRLKKKWFNGVNNMMLVTPSLWLAGLTRESFLKNYPVRVINNGIDLSVFKPTESDFRAEYNCQDKIIILGVAFGWGKRKGIDVFIELSKRLDEKYQIVLVGTNDNVDRLLPDNVISIHRTENQRELAEIYTTADVFVNPTREENYPTVNMEALACGTPVITFMTGGSPEIIDDTCGIAVDKDDVDALEREIVRISENMIFSEEACLKRAKSFDMNIKFKEYVDLYESL